MARPERPVSFSALRKRVGMRDSAQFNYHLSKLTDHFVRSTDDGYEFQYAGEKVVRAILAGTFTDRVSLSVPITGTCFACGDTLVGQYADERLSVECAACTTTYARYAFPPGASATARTPRSRRPSISASATSTAWPPTASAPSAGAA